MGTKNVSVYSQPPVQSPKDFMILLYLTEILTHHLLKTAYVSENPKHCNLEQVSSPL